MNRVRLTLRATRARSGVAALALILLAGCLRGDVTDGLQLYQFGAVALTATTGTAVTADATASAVFFEAYSVDAPNSRVTSNFCQPSFVDTSTVPQSGKLRAGTEIGMTIGAGATQEVVSLPFDPTFRRYVSGVRTSYKSGDSATVNIPGETGGYPAASLKVRMAEPLNPQDVIVPTDGTAMQLRWNASPDSTSAILVSLKYANPPSSSFANEQLICSFVDDGAEDIAPNLLTSMLNSPASMRSLKLTRWRTLLINPSTTSVLHIVSSVDTLVKLK